MLTDSAVRSAKRGERPRKLSDGGGLYLLVSPRGGRYWRYNYRYAGKEKTLALGVYPDVSLAKARERHLEARRLLADGIDPSAERKTASKTFEEVAREWHAHWKSNRHERHAQYVLKRLEADVFPRIGSLRLGDIPTSAFRDTVRKIESRGAADIAKRVLQLSITHNSEHRFMVFPKELDTRAFICQPVMHRVGAEESDVGACSEENGVRRP